MIAKQRFGHDCEIRTQKMFGDGYEIKYDTIIDHDTYSYLRVSLEVDREQTQRAHVLLNGRIIGMVEVVVVPGQKKVGYKANRSLNAGRSFVDHLSHVTFSEMGRAVASIISDFVAEK